MEYCESWVGLEPPECATCELKKGHRGNHKATLGGSIRVECAVYEDTLVNIEWENLEE